MIEFQEFGSGRSAEEWDDKLLAFQDFNYQQMYSFVEFEKTRMSNQFRAVLVDGSKTLVMAQGLIRKSLFGTCVLVIRGGPAYQALNNENVNLKNLRLFLRQLIKFNKEQYKFSYINITINGERSVISEIALREAGMSKPFFERAPYLTYMVPIYHDPQLNMAAFDAKWRNQLRRAEGLNPSCRWGSDESLLKSYISLHNSMCQIKSIQSYSISYEDMISMQRHFGEKLQFLIVSHAGQDVCGCAVIIIHNKAFYYYAAANEQGRIGYFSNAMVWNLIHELQKAGVTELDMSGIDPVRNWGGYHFKKGAGGRPYAYIGEWDYGSSNLMKLLMNVALFWRSRRMYR